MSAGAAPLVSVIVFLREPGTRVAETLRSLAGQTRFADIEVILADGAGAAAFDALGPEFPWLRRLRLPGANMPRLKGRAIEAARGAIVAILDPWDAAEPDWIEQVLAGLEARETGALGGAVALGGPPTAVNRAAYLFEYGDFNPPLDGGPTGGELPGNNLAFRRALLLEVCADILEREGFNKPFCQARLRERGGALVMRPSMRVRHLTAHRFVPFAVRRFHYARCFGATRLRLSPPPRRLLYRVFAPAVPALLMWRHLAKALRHPANRRLLRGAGPALLAVCAVWGVGEWAGTWFGPGRSCDKLY